MCLSEHFHSELSQTRPSFLFPLTPPPFKLGGHVPLTSYGCAALGWRHRWSKLCNCLKLSRLYFFQQMLDIVNVWTLNLLNGDFEQRYDFNRNWIYGASQPVSHTKLNSPFCSSKVYRHTNIMTDDRRNGCTRWRHLVNAHSLNASSLQSSVHQSASQPYEGIQTSDRG